ncbi:MAG: transposase [Planctomycetota bacterium]
MNDDLKLFVGVDWATEEHEVHAMDPGGEKVGARSFKHSGDGLADLCKWLLDKADPASVAIAIEVPHGSVSRNSARTRLQRLLDQPETAGPLP